MEPAGFYCQLEETRLNWEERPSFEELPGSEGPVVMPVRNCSD